VNVPPEVLARGFAVFGVVVLGTISVALIYEWIQERGRERAVRKQLRALQEMAGVGPAGQNTLLRADVTALRNPLLAAVFRIPVIASLEVTMREAGVSWRLGTFLLISTGCALASALLILTITGIPGAAMVAAFAGSLLPLLHVRRQRRLRLQAFEEALPDALDLLARAIRAGHPIGAGIKIVADEAEEPVAGEFQRTFDEQRFGLPFEDTMLALSLRMPLIDLRMLVTAILIQREVGGNLAEVLDNLGDVIRQRFVVQRQLRVHTAQGRLSGHVLAFLPVVVGSIIYVVNPAYVGLLFDHPLGRLMLISAAVLQVIGFMWIRRIINIEI
jgi:tight adherence protein B